MAIPTKQTALLANEDGSIRLSTDVAVTRLEDHMVLVKTHAVGLNPIDTKMKGPLAAPGTIAGMDFAGEVVAVGPHAATPGSVQVGDRVCGAVIGYSKPKPTVGAFAEVVGAEDIGLMRLPADWSYEQGATLGCAVSTIGLALFRSLEVPGTLDSPTDKPVDVLVYGGSTATGTMAIQLLKLAGFNPITTCSPHNFPLVTSYGAAHAFDYRSPTAVADIRALTRNSLKFALDCVSEPDTMAFCYAALGRTGGKYTALEPFAAASHTRPRTVVPDWVLGFGILGQPITWPAPFERGEDAEVRAFGVEYFRTVQRLLDEGRVRPHPVRVVEGGLGGVQGGLELLKAGKVSGCKLVCSVA